MLADAVRDEALSYDFFCGAVWVWMTGQWMRTVWGKESMASTHLWS